MIRPILAASTVAGLILVGAAGAATATTQTTAAPQQVRCLFGLSELLGLRALCTLPLIGQVDQLTATVPTVRSLTRGAMDDNTLRTLISAFPVPNADTLRNLTHAIPGEHTDLDEDDEADQYGD
ncbi:hypothetical protein [Nonomuraea sediminis]|uniref:hypothetical protein n=1 Tax=Nonomuraea sediminis TaxID=2835864 RepID=UPI001BDC9B2A|nr:hypothetical protein [Nonomuraea sediminis]